MKKTRFGILFILLLAIFAISAFAKTHKTDIVTTDTIEYTLEEEDKLSAELFVEEDGLYDVKLISLSTSGNFAPVAETYNGGVYLYASDVPEADVTVPVIICWKGNA
jgi:hypothetical protein